MIDAAIGAALLFACLNDPGTTRAARAKLSEKIRLRGVDPRLWKLQSLFKIAFVAVWLPDSRLDGVVLGSEYLADTIRELLNSVQPSRRMILAAARDFEYAFRDSRGAYVLPEWPLASSTASSKGT